MNICDNCGTRFKVKEIGNMYPYKGYIYASDTLTCDCGRVIHRLAVAPIGKEGEV